MPAALDLLDEVLGADHVGPGLARLALLLALGEDGHPHRLADAVGQHDRAPHHLVGVLGIDPEPEGQVHRLVELRRAAASSRMPIASSTEYSFSRCDRRRRRVVAACHALASCTIVAMSSRSLAPLDDSMPMLRAVPSTIRIADSMESVLRSTSLVWAISRTCGARHLADLVLVRHRRGLRDARRALEQDRGRRRLHHEGERPVLVDRHHHRQDQAFLGAGLGVEALAELHDVDAVLAERRAHRRRRVGLARPGSAASPSPGPSSPCSEPLHLVVLELDGRQPPEDRPP